MIVESFDNDGNATGHITTFRIPDKEKFKDNLEREYKKTGIKEIQALILKYSLI